MRLPKGLPAAVLVLLAGSATAQETIDNREFDLWSKFEKGASATLKSTTTAGGMTTEAVMTTTLVEVGKDKLVVEYTIASKTGGKEFKTPPMKRDVPRKVTLPKGAPKLDGKKPAGTFEEGAETLKVGGAELKTKWYKFKSDMGGLKAEGQTWMSDDVPGSVVKLKVKTSGTADSETNLELVEFKKK